MTLLGLRAGDRLALIALFSVAVGCQLTPAPGLVECPLAVTQQAAEVVRVAPLGTPRDDVMQRLKDAGIRGNFGENESIFYCDVWNRDSGERWHINVVLLFDTAGRLYATRPDLAAGSSPSETERAKVATEQVVDPFQ